MTKPLQSVDPLADLLRQPARKDAGQPAVFLTGDVVDVDAETATVSVSIRGTVQQGVSVLSTVGYADVPVGAKVALLGIRDSGLATYMVIGTIHTPPVADASFGSLRLFDILEYHRADSGDAFVKGAYPGLRAALVEVQGGGGPGSGASSTGATQWTAGTGGQAGAYARSLLWAVDLGASETVTVGAAGTSGGATDAASTSSFGVHVVAPGGQGGSSFSAGNTSLFLPGNGPAQTVTGQVAMGGGAGHPAGRIASSTAHGGNGGDSMLGRGGPGGQVGTTGTDAAGTGSGYGAGGGGAANGPNQSAQPVGGSTAGIVIIHLYG